VSTLQENKEKPYVENTGVCESLTIETIATIIIKAKQQKFRQFKES